MNIAFLTMNEKIPLTNRKNCYFSIGSLSRSRNLADFSARETQRPNNRPKISEILSKFDMLALGVFNFFLLTVRLQNVKVFWFQLIPVPLQLIPVPLQLIPVPLQYFTNTSLYERKEQLVKTKEYFCRTGRISVKKVYSISTFDRRPIPS